MKVTVEGVEYELACGPVSAQLFENGTPVVGYELNYARTPSDQQVEAYIRGFLRTRSQ